MNYNNPDGSFATTWTNLKLSWVAVSTQFEKFNNDGQYVWAGSVGMTAPFTNNIPGPVITNSLWGAIPAAAFADAVCGYVDGPTPYFDVDCDAGLYLVLGDVDVFDATEE